MSSVFFLFLLGDWRSSDDYRDIVGYAQHSDIGRQL